MTLAAQAPVAGTVRLVNRPTLQYVVLALLALIASAYQIGIARDVLLTFNTHVPLFSMATASNVIELVRDDAAAAGLQRGDEVLAINGRPYTGTSVRAEEFVRAKPGMTMVITVRRTQTGREHTVYLPVTRNDSGFASKGLVLLLYIVVPFFCLALGFWTALARPRDPLAWLLLGLMLAFPQIFEPQSVANWGPG